MDSLVGSVGTSQLTSLIKGVH